MFKPEKMTVAVSAMADRKTFGQGMEGRMVETANSVLGSRQRSPQGCAGRFALAHAARQHY